ncbi:MAG: gamma-glutamylcyclotransferase [Acidaminococcaceae bacterium]|nr:gamma-glutamylcyclotransferase [Acidaminococcaceae bacterium]
MKLYIAYGSNLNIDQMKHRCPDAQIVGTTFISGYRLTFRGNSRHNGVANVEPEKGSIVPVGVWLISPMDEVALDRYEGYPWLYYKKDFRILIHGKIRMAMGYVMTPGHEYAAPSDSYLQTIVDGFDDFNIDTGILFDAVIDTQKRLETRPASFLERFSDLQWSYHLPTCPRCGRPNMKPSTATNALSRHANVYICDECGMDEALRDFTGKAIPLTEWAICQK